MRSDENHPIAFHFGGVQGVEIIISNTWVEDFYIMFEFFPTERGYFWDIEWKTKDVRARTSVKRE